MSLKYSQDPSWDLRELVWQYEIAHRAAHQQKFTIKRADVIPEAINVV